MRLKGHFRALQYRDNCFIRKYTSPNAVVVEGLEKMLEIAFIDAAKVTWFVGLIDATGYTGFNDLDTLASHPGWTENQQYIDDRKAWGPEKIVNVSRTIGNTSAVSFTMNANATIAGMFICSIATGNVGTLWSEAKFDNDIVVVSGDVVKVFYELEADKE